MVCLPMVVSRAPSTQPDHPHRGAKEGRPGTRRALFSVSDVLPQDLQVVAAVELAGGMGLLPLVSIGSAAKSECFCAVPVSRQGPDDPQFH